MRGSVECESLGMMNASQRKVERWFPGEFCNAKWDCWRWKLKCIRVSHQWFRSVFRLFDRTIYRLQMYWRYTCLRRRRSRRRQLQRNPFVKLRWRTSNGMRAISGIEIESRARLMRWVNSRSILSSMQKNKPRDFGFRLNFRRHSSTESAKFSSLSARWLTRDTFRSRFHSSVETLLILNSFCFVFAVDASASAAVAWWDSRQ